MNIIEQNLIGSLLIDSTTETIAKVHDKVSAEMFLGSKLYGRIYLEYQRGYENHYAVDVSILRQKLVDEGWDAEMLDRQVAAAVAETATSLNADSYADGVVRRYKAWRLSKVLEGFKPQPSAVYEQIGLLQGRLEEIAGNEAVSSQSLAEIAEKYRGEYFKKHPPRITMGFERLDGIVGGFEGGDLIVIGARPGVGKSAFVTQFVSRLGRRGARIGFYNLEMTDRQMYERFVVNESGLGLSYLRRAESCTADEMERFNRANEALIQQKNIRIIDDGAKTVQQIRNESRHMEYGLIVVDYLQLLMPDKTYRGNRQAEVGEISRGLKNLAKELKIPVIALSQLNRLSEGRDNREPTMSELREAGNIEQDASVIILMWNMGADNQDLKGCKVAKNRQGQLGKVVLKFNGDLMRFEETGMDVDEIRREERRRGRETPFDGFVPSEDAPFS